MSIEYSKNNTYDYVWLSIFNIPSVGKTTAKLLLKELGSIDNILNSDITTLSNIFSDLGTEMGLSIRIQHENLFDSMYHV